jgi:hypothetical protein
MVRTSFEVLGPSGSERGYEHRPPRAPWLMVPKNGTRALTLNVDGGHSVTIRNADSQGAIRNYIGMPACEARIVGNQLLLRGLLDYRDIPVDLVHRGRELRVMVSVKNRKTLPIIAQYVEHGPLLKTRMTRELVRETIEQANAIYFQANVRLLLALEAVLGHERIFQKDAAAKDAASGKPAKRSLGRVVRDSEEWQLITKHRHTVPYRENVEYPPLNVFFVRVWDDVDEEGQKASNELASTDNQGNCIFEDPVEFGRNLQAKHAGKVLAHEVGHHLLFLGGIADGGAHHVKSDSYNLMYELNERLNGTRLTRDQIETMNPSIPFRQYDGTIRLPR